MSKEYLEIALEKAAIITKSGLSIYEEIDIGDKNYWFTVSELQELLNFKLIGLNLNGLPLRTRSKKVKSEICTALGYPIPKSFRKTQPRFIGQRFDTYTQKSYNLQVWNEDLDLSRRYVLIKISKENIVTKVKVVLGKDLAPLDTTGTFTQKYQARLKGVKNKFELVSDIDTTHINKLCGSKNALIFQNVSPVHVPLVGKLLPIKTIYQDLQKIVGKKFPNPGDDQERNRGAVLHKLVCQILGFQSYQDNGQFPDIKNQLLEIKLQTSSTIDLGLVSPDSKAPLGIEKIEGIIVRHCDVRYAIFCGNIKNGVVEITNLIVTNGEDFFDRFPKFEGRGLNKKIQIQLPKDYFNN